MKSKTALAPRNQFISMIFPSLFSLFFILIVLVWIKEHPNLIWVLAIGILLNILILFWKYKHSYNLYFNAHFIYLQNKFKTIQIPLSDLKVEKNESVNVRILGIDHQTYKLTYRDKEGVLRKMNDWISPFNDGQSTFESYLNK